MEERTPIGERIAYWRKRRGKTQAELAGLVGRCRGCQPSSRGKHPMDSISVLLMLANVLKVGIWELQPKLGLPPNAQRQRPRRPTERSFGDLPGSDDHPSA